MEDLNRFLGIIHYKNLAHSFNLFDKCRQLFEAWNSWVTKSSYQIELRKMTSHFELLTRRVFQKFFFRVTNSTSQNIKLNFELLTRRFNFYFSSFELLTQSWKKKFLLRVTNSKIKFLFFYSRVTNLKSRNKKLHFELLTRSQII